MSKKISMLFTILTMSFLTGCLKFNTNQSGSVSTQNSYNNQTSSSFTSCDQLTSTSSISGGMISTISTPEILESSSKEDVDEKKIIDIYAINDYHGRIQEDTSKGVPGIAKLASYLDAKKAENKDGYIFINSGDYWQDTYDSGTNKGKLLTECLDLMECEALALGNHEFDWGIDIIRENKQYTSYTKFLGANIRQYPNYYESVDFAEPYKIVEREGLKIGIIGAIGEGQITSITSSNWEDITFLPHTDIVKDISDELRIEKDCDIVILSIHADESDANGQEITKISSLSQRRYVDAVFCAHSHQREITYYNEVPFIQAGAHGENLSHVQFEFQNDHLRVLKAGYEKYSSTNVAPDKEVQAVVNKYLTAEFIETKNKVHGTITGGSSISSDLAGRILAKATFDHLKEKGINADIVLNNGARDTVATGNMTSEKIFNMMPFTNKTLVVKNITGQDIINECINYGNPYFVSNPSQTINPSSYYTVACVDYVMTHKNTNRVYNYFRSYKETNVIHTIEDYPNILIEEYLQKNKTINLSDYKSLNYTGLKAS